MHIQRILKIALEKERKAYKAYLKAASLARDAVDKTLLRNLALEEKKHEKILRNQINLAKELSKDKVGNAYMRSLPKPRMGNVKLKAAEDLAKVYFKTNKELQKLHMEFTQEEKAAALIQKNLIPEKCPQTKGLQISAVSHMARRIGGDFFDFWQNNEDLHFVIADIMGKGLPASLLMSSLRSFWKSFAVLDYKPNKAVTLINKVTYEDFTLNQSFSTLISVFYDDAENTLYLCNAGNEPPLYFNHKTKKISFLSSREILVGVDRIFKYKGRKQKLNLGDIVIFFTDGLPLYRDLKEVKEIILQNYQKDVKDILDLIINKPMENLRDDTSIIIIKRR